MLRRLIVVVLVAALLWGGHWVFGAWGLEKATRAWLDARRADGWVAEAESVVVRGFPNRFDMKLSGLQLADPQTGWAWTAPFFQTLALSYQPYRIIAVWPPEQVLQTPLERLTISGERLRGSLFLAPDTSLALQRSSFELDGLSIRSDAGWETRLTEGAFATRVVPAENPDPLTHQISFKARSWQVPSRLLARFAGTEALPDTLDAVDADMTVRFSAPWDRAAIERARPQPRQIDVALAEAKWGAMELKLAGSLDIDENGQPTGTMTVKATNWREILQIGIAAGLVPKRLERPISSALELASQLSGTSETLDIPLNFKDGEIRIGLAAIAPAPVILLR